MTWHVSFIIRIVFVLYLIRIKNDRGVTFIPQTTMHVGTVKIYYTIGNIVAYVYVMAKKISNEVIRLKAGCGIYPTDNNAHVAIIKIYTLLETILAPPVLYYRSLHPKVSA